MKFLSHLITKYSIALLILFYLASRLTNLLILPIFNDEAIYLDWGHTMTNTQLVYYSLFDGKQPLMMWLFGWSQRFFSDPLLAGRIVSVVWGLIGLLGIYTICKHFYNLQTQIIALLLYVFSPLFIFFDRQALMESAVSAIGIWTLFILLKILKAKHSYSDYLFLGFLWALGLWTKSNTIIFVLSSLIIYLIFSQKKPTILRIIYSLIITALLLVPLMTLAESQQILISSNRHSFSPSELFTFPVAHWLVNLLLLIKLIFFQVSGSLIIFLPHWLSRTKKLSTQDKAILLWLFFSLSSFVLLSKSPIPRYIVSFTPPLVILITKSLQQLKTKQQALLTTIALASFILIDLTLFFNPLSYFSITQKLFSNPQQKYYVNNFPSGYGVKEAVNYTKNQIKDQQAIVFVRLDAGNPESTVHLYLNNQNNIKVNHIGGKQASLENISRDSDVKRYFISRDNHVLGLEKQLTLQKRFFKPDQVSSVGVYKFN